MLFCDLTQNVLLRVGGRWLDGRGGELDCVDVMAEGLLGGEEPVPR